MQEAYLDINRRSWNSRVDAHYASDFYKVKEFVEGACSLQSIELEQLGDVRGLRILHVQCHFGQDSIALSRRGAEVTGVDFSEKAIAKARELAELCGTKTRFVCCDVYDLTRHLDETFDVVFTSYGVLGWLPDLDRWASTLSRFLKPGGRFFVGGISPGGLDVRRRFFQGSVPVHEFGAHPRNPKRNLRRTRRRPDPAKHDVEPRFG